ncbi:hypothetical protein [Egicoccus halophilus]|uniref:Uncharacterized protein n=1 Tax=Egicoccus halophilus TaxID=1670830 RepID=A0A8J3AB83_9ACTN|nr:hypothetical protein [Egicoccus halophilus]GGI09331.1 hypothetical protein GCM10011354_33550 [Egicoccus halophilus]
MDRSLSPRSPATWALVVLLAAQAAVATATVVVAGLVASDDGGGNAATLDPTALGVLSVGIGLLVGLVALLVASLVGLLRGRAWAATTAGLVQAVLVVGAAVGLLSLGWQPPLAVLLLLGGLGLLLLAGRARERRG